MVDDALASDRLIGMVQPLDRTRDMDPIALSLVGCAGRLSSFEETNDGRYLISLTGVCRFRIHEEVSSRTPYRIVKPDWSDFGADLRDTDTKSLGDGAALLEALEGYLTRKGLNADWKTIRSAPLDLLVNSLSTGCPFSNPEKQALLEAPTLKDRYGALLSLLVMERPGHAGGYVQ